MGDPAAVGDFIESELAKVADPGRAEKERAYLKSELVFLGVGVPATRRLVRESWTQNDGLDHDGLIATVNRLWGSDIHEHRMATVELLKLAPPAALSVDDRPMLEHLLSTARTWAYVDSLAADVVGTLVVSSPKAWSPVGVGRRLLDSAISLAVIVGSPPPRRRRLRAVLALCGRHARRARILHSQGHRLGPARHQPMAPRARR